MMPIFAKVKIFLEMIKFPHTVFALPFAFTGAILAAKGLPTTYQAFWILLAMIGARTAAMGLNRIVDAEIDRRNPRTCGRAIPAGLLGKGFVATAILLSFMLFLYAAYRLNALCLYLSPVAIILLILYSYCKRFTSFSHVVLGLCLAAAPVGAWIAVKGSVELPALLLGMGVLFWVAGFDILYALQDLDFDRAAGLYSIPARLGVVWSLRIARICHLVLPVMLLVLFFILNLGVLYLVGLVAVVALLIYEHRLVWDGGLAKLDAAFFTMNGYISLVLFIFTVADVILLGRGV